jgi:excisionase family DNA binding protein
MKPIGLSIRDAGQALGGISRATIYRMIARRELEALKLGSRTLITTASLESCAANARRLAA